jgi:hypothetical protein
LLHIVSDELLHDGLQLPPTHVATSEGNDVLHVLPQAPQLALSLPWMLVHVVPLHKVCVESVHETWQLLLTQ